MKDGIHRYKGFKWWRKYMVIYNGSIVLSTPDKGYAKETFKWYRKMKGLIL